MFFMHVYNSSQTEKYLKLKKKNKQDYHGPKEIINNENRTEHICFCELNVK